MQKRQKEIIRELAKEHGISIAQAEEVWALFIDKIVTTISSTDKMKDDQYVSDRFKTIHIDNFGKFVPNLRNIRHANMCLKNNKKKND